jgi:hypothetical protein
MYTALIAVICLVSLFAFLIIWAVMVVYARSYQQPSDSAHTQTDSELIERKVSPNEPFVGKHEV